MFSCVRSTCIEAWSYIVSASYNVAFNLRAVAAAEGKSKEVTAREFKVDAQRIQEWRSQKEKFHTLSTLMHCWLHPWLPPSIGQWQTLLWEHLLQSFCLKVMLKVHVVYSIAYLPLGIALQWCDGCAFYTLPSANCKKASSTIPSPKRFKPFAYEIAC